MMRSRECGSRDLAFFHSASQLMPPPCPLSSLFPARHCSGLCGRMHVPEDHMCWNSGVPCECEIFMLLEKDIFLHNRA